MARLVRIQVTVAAMPVALRTALSEDDSYYGVYDAEGHAIDGDAPPLEPGDTRRSGTFTIGETPSPTIVAPAVLAENDPPDPVRSALDMNE